MKAPVFKPALFIELAPIAAGRFFAVVDYSGFSKTDHSMYNYLFIFPGNKINSK